MPIWIQHNSKFNSKHFNEDNRKEIFYSYWALRDTEKQRQFISNCMQIVEPRYHYVRVGGNRTPRQKNKAYFLQNCFLKTLLISMICQYAPAKWEKLANQVLEPEQRGKHSKHKNIDKNIASGIMEFIENIPKTKTLKLGFLLIKRKILMN